MDNDTDEFQDFTLGETAFSMPDEVPTWRRQAGQFLILTAVFLAMTALSELAIRGVVKWLD